MSKKKKILNELKTIIGSLEILYNDLENSNLTSNKKKKHKKKKHKKKKHKKNNKSYFGYDDSFDSFSEDIEEFIDDLDLFDDLDFEDKNNNESIENIMRKMINNNRENNKQ